MIINTFKDITDDDLDLTVWRYLSFPKFISLITFQAIWFSKLNILQDQCEGSMPSLSEQKIHKENQKWKTIFPKDLHHQIDEMPVKNVQDKGVANI